MEIFNIAGYIILNYHDLSPEEKRTYNAVPHSHVLLAENSLMESLSKQFNLHSKQNHSVQIVKTMTS